MGKQEGPIPPYPPRTGDHNGVPPRNRVFQGRPGGQTAWNEGSLKQNFGSRVQNLDGISVGSNRESYARGVIGGGEQSSMVGDQFSAPESPELGEATPNLGSDTGGGIGKRGVEMKATKILSDIAPKAVGSAAAGRPDVFGANNTSHSSSISSSTAGEITEKEVNGTDPESSNLG